MDSPRSALDSGTAMQALPARPTIKKTYGKPQADKPPAMHADESFTSDLTSLSQLSQAPPASSAPKQPAARSWFEAESDSENEDGEDKESADSGYYAPQKSIKDMLLEVDEAFDAALDGVSALSKQFTLPEPITVPANDEQPATEFSKRERVVSGASSSSTNEAPRDVNQGLPSTSSPHRVDAHHSSPPTSPRSHAIETHSDEEDEETELPFHSRKGVRSQRKILDSDDEESEAPTKARHDSSSLRKPATSSKVNYKRVIDDDEENINLSNDSEDDDLPSLKDAGKHRATRTDCQSDEEEDVETQKTEGIEQYEDSHVYQSNRLSESPDAKRKSRKSRPPSKKDEEEAHRIAEQSRRSRYASIMPRSKPARPLSEISQRLQGPEHSNKPLSSMRPSMTHRPRSSSTKPALSLRAASIPKFSMQASNRPLQKAIEIGSSSAIYDFNMDEDSYDPSYLKAGTQSQNSYSAKQDSKPAAPAKSSTSPIVEAEDDSDVDLPDAIQAIKERKAKDQKAKALQAKKAALLARQQARTEQRKPEEDVKGKGREIIMDLDSDPEEELEIEVARVSTPIIQRAAHASPRSHKLMKRLALKSAKKEHDDDMSESQFNRAGRTFHHGDENVVVNPHVATKAPRAKNTQGKQHSVTAHGVYNLLMEKAKQQALNDKVKRMEDWKRRGGTLRHDYGTEDVMQAEDEEGQDDRAKDLMNAIQARAVETPQNDEDDEEDDEDYIGSDDEAAILSGEDQGSANEEDDEDLASSDKDEDDENLKIADGGSTLLDSMGHRAPNDPDFAGDLSSIATTQVIPSDPTEVSDAESEDVVVVSTRVKPTKRLNVAGDDSQGPTSATSDSEESAHNKQDPAQATQYHEFVVKNAAPAFPEFDNINDISLTQAFGKVGATQAPPQASKAVFDEGDGFSQMFGDDDATGFTQAVSPTQAVSAPKLDGPMPSMFRKGGDSSPEVQRHAFGEAPMLLDAALRDAQIREEAERAYDQIQLHRSRSVGEKQDIDLTTTPGSAVSDEMPPLPPVTIVADRYTDRGMSIDDTQSEAGSDDESIQMEDINSPSMPRKLRRAGEVGNPSSKRPKNAFDLLQMGQQKHLYGQKDDKKQKKKSDFIAEEVEESEDEGEYSMLRKINDEGDEEDGSDLDAAVEELVDDEKGDPDEEEAQDEMVDEHHRDWAQKDEAKTHKLVEKVIAGKMKKRRRDDGDGLSDSDYDDDMMHRQAKARKPKKFSTKMEALTANPETQSFAQAGMDDGTGDINGDFLEAPDPSSEAASDDDEYGSEFEDVPTHRPSRHYAEQNHAYSRDYEKSIIDKAIYGVPSSPQQEVLIEDSLTIITSRTLVQKKSGMDCFDDIDLSYAETQTLTRRVVQLEREESQNENGRGPGRTSAVTNFVRRQGQETAGGAGRTQKVPVQSSANLMKKKENKVSRPTLETGNRGRLAAARQSKR